MTVIDNVPSPSIDVDLTGGELPDLLDRRATIFRELNIHRAMGDLDNNDPYHRAREALQAVDRRISELQISIAEKSPVPAHDDGVVGAGSFVTVAFDHDESDVETFALITSEAPSSSDGVETCSPTSPLGEVLMGSRVGDTCSYSLPTGAQCTVTVLEVTAALQ